MEKILTPNEYKKLTNSKLGISMIRKLVKDKVLNGFISDGGHYYIIYKTEN